MKTTCTILFYLKSNPNRHGQHAITIRITINGRSTSFASGQAVEPQRWDQKRQCVTGHKATAKSINHILDTIKADLIGKYNYHHFLRRESVTAHRLKKLYLGTDTQPSELLTYFDCFNKTQQKIVGKGISQSSHNKYVLTRKRLVSFIPLYSKTRDIPMECIDLDFIMAFERYLRDRFCLCNNSVEKLMRIFRRIVMLAVYNGKLMLDPFKHYRIRVERVERPYLTQEELDRVSGKHFTIERMEKAKDIYLFCCFTGLSYIDAVNLDRSNLETGFDGNKWLTFYRQKTGIFVRIRLFRIPAEILDKYASLPGNHLLPMITNQRMNGYLKEIADCCGIHKSLTFHTARHTFATTVALNNGMPIESLAKILGHTNIKSTLVYARVVDRKLINDMEALAQKLD